MSTKSKPAAAAETQPTPAAAPAAPFTDAQLAAIDARVLGTLRGSVQAVVIDQLDEPLRLGDRAPTMVDDLVRRCVGQMKDELLTVLGAQIADAVRVAHAANALAPAPALAEPARPRRDVGPDDVLSLHEVARLADLDPEAVMTRDDGTPAYAVRDGRLAVTTTDGRRIEVPL